MCVGLPFFIFPLAILSANAYGLRVIYLASRRWLFVHNKLSRCMTMTSTVSLLTSHVQMKKLIRPTPFQCDHGEGKRCSGICVVFLAFAYSYSCTSSLLVYILYIFLLHPVTHALFLHSTHGFFLLLLSLIGRGGDQLEQLEGPGSALDAQLALLEVQIEHQQRSSERLLHELRRHRQRLLSESLY